MHAVPWAVPFRDALERLRRLRARVGPLDERAAREKRHSRAPEDEAEVHPQRETTARGLEPPRVNRLQRDLLRPPWIRPHVIERHAYRRGSPSPGGGGGGPSGSFSSSSSSGGTCSDSSSGVFWVIAFPPFLRAPWSQRV